MFKKATEKKAAVFSARQAQVAAVRESAQMMHQMAKAGKLSPAGLVLS